MSNALFLWSIGNLSYIRPMAKLKVILFFISHGKWEIGAVLLDDFFFIYENLLFARCFVSTYLHFCCMANTTPWHLSPGTGHYSLVPFLGYILPNLNNSLFFQSRIMAKFAHSICHDVCFYTMTNYELSVT